MLNFTDPVAVLRHTREVADVMAYIARVDTLANRAAFRFGETETGDDIPERYRTMLDRLGIARDHYEPEFGYDDATRQRYLRIHLVRPVTVAGRLTLPAGRRVHLWRHHHRSEDELAAMLVAAGYAPLTARRDGDGEFVLLAGRNV